MLKAIIICGGMLLGSFFISCCPAGDEDTEMNQMEYSDIVPGDGSKATGTGCKILILMYHNIVTGFPANEYDRKKSDFEDDLKYLQSKNYQLISMEDLLKLKNGQMQLNSDAVIITFDDGYAACYSKAVPLLKKYNMPATFFIVPEWIGTNNYMSAWSKVWQMHDYTNGQGKHLFSIHSHTSSHPFLQKAKSNFTPAVYQNFLNLQLGESRSWIVDVTHQPSMFLALPYGDGAGDTAITNTAIRQGYDGIRTSERASFTVDEMDLYRLPSLPILSTTTIKSMEKYF